MRLIAGYAGRVKDFRPIFAKKEDLRAELPKGQQHNSNIHILPQNMKKSNYSVVCRRCGRKLTSVVSRNRGYGSYCYRRMIEENAKNMMEKQGNIDDLLKGGSGMHESRENGKRRTLNGVK